jgi:hypothetical protein
VDARSIERKVLIGTGRNRRVTDVHASTKRQYDGKIKGRFRRQETAGKTAPEKKYGNGKGADVGSHLHLLYINYEGR